MNKFQISKAEIKMLDEETIFLEFSLNKECDYYITLFHEDGVWVPYDIHHDFEKNEHNEICSYCQIELRYGRTCNELDKHFFTLYNLLLDEPKIRLKLLSMGIRKMKERK